MLFGDLLLKTKLDSKVQVPASPGSGVDSGLVKKRSDRTIPSSLRNPTPRTTCLLSQTRLVEVTAGRAAAEGSRAADQPRLAEARSGGGIQSEERQVPKSERRKPKKVGGGGDELAGTGRNQEARTGTGTCVRVGDCFPDYPPFPSLSPVCRCRRTPSAARVPGSTPGSGELDLLRESPLPAPPSSLAGASRPDRTGTSRLSRESPPSGSTGQNRCLCRLREGPGLERMGSSPRR